MSLPSLNFHRLPFQKCGVQKAPDLYRNDVTQNEKIVQTLSQMKPLLGYAVTQLLLSDTIVLSAGILQRRDL